MPDPRTPNTSRQRESPRAQAAYEAYAAKGRGRSLAKLHRHLTNVTPGNDTCPSLDGLKFWSRTYGWVNRVAEHDAKVAEAVEAKVIRREAKRRVDALDGLNDLIGLCNSIISEAVSDTGKLRAETPGELRAVGATLAEAAKIKELLEGRATDRLDNMSPAELKARLAEVNKELAKLPGGGEVT